MKLAILLIPLSVVTATAHAQSVSSSPSSLKALARAPQPGTSGNSGPVQQKIAPGLARYTDELLYGRVWPGVGLTPRDRSLVVLSSLISTTKPEQLKGHLGRALVNGVTPVEASAVLTHLALYAGWPNAVTALGVYDTVYTERKIDLATLQNVVRDIPPTVADRALARSVASQIGPNAPKFTRLTEETLFNDLWRRSDLSVRDRSLVTIAALAAMGDAELIAPYVRRGLEAGLKRGEMEEAMIQLAFYAGWGKATKALDAISEVIETESGR